MGSLGLGNGSLRMDDVYLEGATPEGPAVVGHLSVIVDSDGITFLGPEPGERRTVGWERSSPLEFGAPAALPDGEQGTCLEFVVDGRPLRLLVPSKKGAHDAPGASGEAPPASDPPTRPAHLAEPPLFIDPPAPAVADAPALLLQPPEPTPVEPVETVLETQPAPTLLEPPAPTLRQPPAAVPMPLPVSDPVGPPAAVVVDDIALVPATTHDDAGTDTLSTRRPMRTNRVRYGFRPGSAMSRGSPVSPRSRHRHAPSESCGSSSSRCSPGSSPSRSGCATSRTGHDGTHHGRGPDRRRHRRHGSGSSPRTCPGGAPARPRSATPSPPAPRRMARPP